MTLQPAALESMEVDALRLDRYLDALLSAVDRRAADVPADPALDPACRLAGRRLRDELVRTHPSFRFEERLAGRLADAAARMRLAAAAGGEAEVAIIPFPTPLLADATPVPRPANPGLAGLLGARHAAIALGSAARRPARGAVAPAPADVTIPALRPVVTRPMLVGGALTSAALSLAGAAFVAWRLTRGAPADPTARVGRAVRLARVAPSARETVVATATQAPAAAGSAQTAVDATLGHRRLA